MNPIMKMRDRYKLVYEVRVRLGVEDRSPDVETQSKGLNPCQGTNVLWKANNLQVLFSNQVKEMGGEIP